MSYRAFVTAAYALLVETYNALGNDLLTAIDRVNETLGLSEAETPGAGVPSPKDNAAALAELERMMPR